MRADRYNELIVFLIRETGWTLEYVRRIPYTEFALLVDELSYQKAVDDYNRNYPLGIIAAILASDRTHQKRPSDFIGRPPERKNKGDDTWKQAKEAGVKIPEA